MHLKIKTKRERNYVVIRFAFGIPVKDFPKISAGCILHRVPNLWGLRNRRDWNPTQTSSTKHLCSCTWEAFLKPHLPTVPLLNSPVHSTDSSAEELVIFAEFSEWVQMYCFRISKWKTVPLFSFLPFILVQILPIFQNPD